MLHNRRHTNAREAVPILDITTPIRTEGFTTEWVLACPRCQRPADHGDHAGCDVVLSGAPLDEPVDTSLAVTPR